MHTFFSALRALFVLGCLVMVPLMAVFGTSLPATLIAALSGQDAATAPTTAPQPPLAAPKVAASALLKTPLPSQSPASPLAAGAAGEGHEAAPSSPPGAVSAAGSARKFSPAPRGAEPPTTNVALGSFPPVHPASASVPLPPVPPREKFSSLETRLQQLGAKYYRLVTAGDQNELFHFECQLPVPSDPAAPRVFEATDADPLQAVARVVHQVEDYRSGRWQ